MKNVSSVFWIVIAITFVAVMWGAFSPQTLQNVTDQIQTYITNDFGWYYLIVISLLVGFCLFFIFSPIGKITLGKPGEEPEFGIFLGLRCYLVPVWELVLSFMGLAEPISHYAIQSPTGETETAQAFRDSLRYTFFHWGLHAWAHLCDCRVMHRIL